MRIIKILIFLFLFSFTTHAFAKSNEYYQSVITNIITNCKTDQCRKDIFEQEVHIAFFNLLDAILNQVQFEISQRKKEKSKLFSPFEITSDVGVVVDVVAFQPTDLWLQLQLNNTFWNCN